MNQYTISKKQSEFDAMHPLFELRLYVYDLLRRAFLQEPNSALVEELQLLWTSEGFPFQSESQELAQGVDEVNQFLRNLDVQDVEAMDQLRWDYTRLFVGPHELPTPPWESAYRTEERLLFQQETLAVRRAYLKYALITQDFRREADDHLGLELDFMYQLCLLALERIEAKDYKGVRAITEDQQAFLREHLLEWVPQLGLDLIQHANTPLYRGLAKVLRGFLAVEAQATQEVLEVLETDMAPAI